MRVIVYYFTRTFPERRFRVTEVDAFKTSIIFVQFSRLHRRRVHSKNKITVEHDDDIILFASQSFAYSIMADETTAESVTPSNARRKLQYFRRPQFAIILPSTRYSDNNIVTGVSRLSVGVQYNNIAQNPKLMQSK